MRPALKSVDGGKRTALPNWMGIIQSSEGLDRTKRHRKDEFDPFSPTTELGR